MIRNHFILEVVPAVGVIVVVLGIYIALLFVIGCISCGCCSLKKWLHPIRSCFVWCYCKIKCKNQPEPNNIHNNQSIHNRDPEAKSCCKRFCELHYKWWEFWVTTIFRNAVTKKVKSDSSEAVLFADIEPDNRCSCCCTPSSCAISYFVVILFWAIVWTWVMFWDNFFYSKLTRCADVNPEDDSITCFFISNYSRAICLELKEQNPNVLCYAYNRGKFFTAGGIAVSVGTFVITASQIWFIAILRCFRKIEEHSSRCCACCSILCLQWIGTIAVVSIILAAWSVVSNLVLPTDSGWNFFYANEPLRWTQFALLCITMLSTVAVPSCVFSYNNYRYLDTVEAVSTNTGSQCFIHPVSSPQHDEQRHLLIDTPFNYQATVLNMHRFNYPT